MEDSTIPSKKRICVLFRVKFWLTMSAISTPSYMINWKKAKVVMGKKTILFLNMQSENAAISKTPQAEPKTQL